MSTLLRTYPVFESNQVLTSTQLNMLFNYLEEQNRQTRARLIGMGIVCGLEVSYDAGKKTVSISKGTGITSEGHLTTLDDTFVATRCRPYELPAGTIYAPFVDAQNQQDITLCELLTDDAEEGTEDQVLDRSLVVDKVVLLFIESFDKDLKSCLGKSCDELGKQRRLALRPLLIPAEDLEEVWARTKPHKHNAAFTDKYNLPVINLKRVLFNHEEGHAKEYEAFCESYASVMKPLIENFEKEALVKTYEIYEPLLLGSYNEKNPFEADSVSENLKQIYAFVYNNSNLDNTFEPYLGIQYVYDFFQDLLLAYNEFRQAAFDLMSECCPDISRFPKHLMLGEVISSEPTMGDSTKYRHIFVQPPVYNLQKELVQRTVFLHNRMVLMIESFDLKRVNGLAFEESEETDCPVRITPSLEKQTPLGERSIPWYYDVNQESSYSGLGTLKENWNYAVSRMYPNESDVLVLNYDDQSDGTGKPDKLSQPLLYDIDEYPFLRIEGHIGKPVSIVLERINEIKTRYNLPFQVLAVQLDQEAGELDPDYSCGFEDIQEEYGIIRAEMASFHRELSADFKFLDEHQKQMSQLYGEDLVLIMNCIKNGADLLGELFKTTGLCVDFFAYSDFQDRYKALLVPICDLLLFEDRVMQAIYDAEELDGEESMVSRELQVLFNEALLRVFEQAHQLDELLFYRALLPLHYSFKRREHYMIRRMAVFSDFLIEHPGLGHQAGVPKGGTFIVLYADDGRVIADLSLPYICCDTSTCVPMCDDGDDGFVFERLPFARPDFAITEFDMPVVIDVMRNDVHLPDDEYIVNATGEGPKEGTLKTISNTGCFLYMPKKEYSGVDEFDFTVINLNNKESASATVKVMVLGAAEADTE